jgi:hypothetical protein
MPHGFAWACFDSMIAGIMPTQSRGHGTQIRTTHPFAHSVEV